MGQPSPYDEAPPWPSSRSDEYGYSNVAHGLRWVLFEMHANVFCFWFLWQANSAMIFLPPQDLPATRFTAAIASASDLNLTNANPCCLPEIRSLGMKQSTILPALQNIASSSTFEISPARLDTNKEKDLYLRSGILEGRGWLNFCLCIAKAVASGSWATALPLKLPASTPVALVPNILNPLEFLPSLVNLNPDPTISLR